MIRKILAVPAGVILGSLCIYLVQTIGHRIYPESASMDTNDINQLAEYVKNAPFMALFFVIISYAVGALSSGFISTKVAGNGSKIYAEICGVIFLIQSIVMMSSLPTPIWFWVLGIAAWLLIFVGWRLAK